MSNSEDTENIEDTEDRGEKVEGEAEDRGEKVEGEAEDCSEKVEGEAEDCSEKVEGEAEDELVIRAKANAKLAEPEGWEETLRDFRGLSVAQRAEFHRGLLARMMTVAIRQNDADAMRRYYDRGLDTQQDLDAAMCSAAYRGRIELVRLCQSWGASNYSRAALRAAANGWFDIVEQCFAWSPAIDVDLIMLIAARDGSASRVKWCLAHGAANLNRAMNMAAARGHLDIVQLMRERGATNFKAAGFRARMMGHTEIAELCREWDAPDRDARIAEREGVMAARNAERNAVRDAEREAKRNAEKIVVTKTRMVTSTAESPKE